MAPSKEPVEQSRTRRTDMQRSGWGGGKTGDDERVGHDVNLSQRKRVHAVPKAHQQREQVRHWSWIWATVTAALQAQAQNLMHWTALGLGVGIAAYFGVSREPGAAVFWAVSLSAGLCAVLAVRLRNGIVRLLIVIALVAAGFS